MSVLRWFPAAPRATAEELLALRHLTILFDLIAYSSPGGTLSAYSVAQTSSIFGHSYHSSVFLPLSQQWNLRDGPTAKECGQDCTVASPLRRQHRRGPHRQVRWPGRSQEAGSALSHASQSVSPTGRPCPSMSLFEDCIGLLAAAAFG